MSGPGQRIANASGCYLGPGQRIAEKYGDEASEPAFQAHSLPRYGPIEKEDQARIARREQNGRVPSRHYDCYSQSNRRQLREELGAKTKVGAVPIRVRSCAALCYPPTRTIC
eukprot:699210-Rhodomonas_salina.2